MSLRKGIQMPIDGIGKKTLGSRAVSSHTDEDSPNPGYIYFVIIYIYIITVPTVSLFN